MIQAGDYIWFRTSVTRRKALGKILYVNYVHGWCTVETKTVKGEKYRESVFIRDIEGIASKEQKKYVDPKSFWSDTSDDWLSEWDEERIDKEVREMANERQEKQ